MVGEDFLDEFFGWLLVSLGDLLKRLVGRSKECIVCSCSIQSFNKVWILVDEFGKLGSVLALGDELVNGQVGLVVIVVAVMRWTTVVRRPVMRMLWLLEDVDTIWGFHGSVEPA